MRDNSGKGAKVVLRHVTNAHVRCKGHHHRSYGDARQLSKTRDYHVSSFQTSWISLIVDSITMEYASYSQIIRQKSTIVLSSGA